MKQFTSTELRIKSTVVYNSVHTDGAVGINHRDRPPMILITRDALNQMIEKGKEKAA